MPVPEEIYLYLLMKEFGGTPSQWRKESSKDIRGILHVMSIYNKVSNDEMERITKKSKIGGKGGKLDLTDPKVVDMIKKAHGIKK